MKLHHFADNHGGRRFQLCRFDPIGQGRQRAADRLLIGPRSPTDADGGRVARAPMLHQLSGDLADVENPHEDHQRFSLPDLAPIDVIHVVAGHKRHELCMIAMGQRHAGVGRDSEGRGHARHNFIRNPSGFQRFELFAAAPKNERIATFETDNVPTSARALDHHLADLFLRKRVCRFFLADVNALGMFRREIEQRFGSEMIVQNGVRDREQLAAFPGNQVGIARSASDQVDLVHAP